MEGSFGGTRKSGTVTPGTKGLPAPPPWDEPVPVVAPWESSNGLALGIKVGVEEVLRGELLFPPDDDIVECQL